MNRERAQQVLQRSLIKSQRTRRPAWRFFKEEMSPDEFRLLEHFKRRYRYGDLQEALIGLVDRASTNRMAHQIALRYLVSSVPRMCYEGPTIPSESTSIKGKGASPALQSLMGSAIQPGMRVLDYGAGKYARNADFLRNQGVEVYAYDLPGNASGEDGWAKGQVSSKLPPKTPKFDVAFTSYVLNVVKCSEEKKIIAACRSFAKRTFHITRNIELLEAITDAIQAQREPVWTFFKEQFAPKYPIALQELEDGYISKDVILQFALFGVQTSRGFQRLPNATVNGLNIIRETKSFTVYEG